MRDKSEILKWSTIIFIVVVLVGFGSVFAYKAVIETEWYHTQMLKKAFRQEKAHLNDHKQIIYVGISPQGNDDTWEYHYDVPEELFDDISCDNFKEISDTEKIEEILGYDWIMIIFKDASKSIYFISPEEEIYWGTSFTVECPSLLEWYREKKN